MGGTGTKPGGAGAPMLGGGTGTAPAAKLGPIATVPAHVKPGYAVPPNSPKFAQGDEDGPTAPRVPPADGAFGQCIAPCGGD
jgi:hypothetical protein